MSTDDDREISRGDNQVPVPDMLPGSESGPERAFIIGVGMDSADDILFPKLTAKDFPDTPWIVEGKCREVPTKRMFPTGWIGELRAKKVCQGCKVASKCLEYALDNRIENGVWGGKTEKQRVKILARR